MFAEKHVRGKTRSGSLRSRLPLLVFLGGDVVFLKIPRPRLKIPCPFLKNFWYDKFMAKIIYINEIPVTIEYRRVKNINLYLKPPEGQVLVTAPRQVPVSRIRTFVEEKERWIRKHQERMQAAAVNREAEPELTRAQRQVLQEKVEFYAQTWEPRMGVHASGWTLRKMKTRWGSCTVGTGRIRINTRLYYFPDEILEYIVVHELCHLIEPSHDKRFQAYMTRFLPDWKKRRRQMREGRFN